MSQRTALAFDCETKALNQARRISGATVVRDDRGNWWAVPLERFARGGVRLSGPWCGGVEADTDPTPPHGITRPMAPRLPLFVRVP